jgi:hypothetical protein
MTRQTPKVARKDYQVNFLALQDFANLSDAAGDLAKFRRKHPDFAPFIVISGQGQDAKLVSPLEARFLPAIVAWRDLLRHVWCGKAGGRELDTLLGLNPEAHGAWLGPAPAPYVSLWNRGLEVILAAGLSVPKRPPTIRARWEAAGFYYEGEEFERAVYALWQSRWRAKVCPMCQSYFVASQKAQKFCSSFCSREGKNASNRRWWHDSGPDWRKHYLTEKAKAERKTKRRKRR